MRVYRLMIQKRLDPNQGRTPRVVGYALGFSGARLEWQRRLSEVIGRDAPPPRAPRGAGYNHAVTDGDDTIWIERVVCTSPAPRAKGRMERA